MKRRWIRLLVFPIMVFGALQGLAASPVTALDNTGTYTDPDIHFSVSWDPEVFGLATVATGGILLSTHAYVLQISPDHSETAADCVKNRVTLDLIDPPLLFRSAYTLDPLPDVPGITEVVTAAYAWDDGVVHAGWFGCLPVGPDAKDGFVVLRLLCHMENWPQAVKTMQPVLDTLVLPNPGSPTASAIGA